VIKLLYFEKQKKKSKTKKNLEILRNNKEKTYQTTLDKKINLIKIS